MEPYVADNAEKVHVQYKQYRRYLCYNVPAGVACVFLWAIVNLYNQEQLCLSVCFVPLSVQGEAQGSISWNVHVHSIQRLVYHK